MRTDPVLAGWQSRDVPDPAARLLTLLSLLQGGPQRSGAELADRLGVTPRTVRRDVERLRALGYGVLTEPGTAGYRLGPGTAPPPLLLDEEEAVALVLGLRAAPVPVAGGEEAAARALAKLQHVLPPRARARAGLLAGAVERVGEAAPPVAPDVLVAVAEACRRREVLRFDHRGRDGTASPRRAEPHRLVRAGRHWYLVAFDRDRDDWRTFRLDRLVPRAPTGPRFAPRPLPAPDAAAWVEERLAWRAWPVRATVRLHVPAPEAAERLWPGAGVLEADGAACLLHVGAPSTADLVRVVTSLDLGFEVVSGPAGFADALRELAARCLRAVAAPEDRREGWDEGPARRADPARGVGNRRGTH